MQLFGAKNSDQLFSFDENVEENVEQIEPFLTQEQCELVATHGAGHVVVSYLLNPDGELYNLKISDNENEEHRIHPVFEENDYQTRYDLMNQIKVSFGGMVAEEFFYGEMSKLCQIDLENCTRIAAQMVGSFGMGKSLVSYGTSHDVANDLVLCVLNNAQCRDEVDRILTMCKNDTRSILDNNRLMIREIRTALLEKNELNHDDLLKLIWSVKNANGQDDNQEI